MSIQESLVKKEIAQKNIVRKHTSAIHIRSEISAIERKISNVLLKNAFQNICLEEQHQISLKDLIAEVGWNNTNKTPQHFIESIRRLNTTQVEWNILSKDKKRKWGVSTLIAGVEIQDGVVFYSYSPELRKWLGKPNIYANLNLEYQKKLNSKHSLVLWEFCTEQLDSALEIEITTKPINLDKLKELLGVSANFAYEEFKNFNRLVIKPAIKEVNEKTDLEIEIHTPKLAKKVISIVFQIKRRSRHKQLEMFGHNKSANIDSINLLKENIEIEDALGKGKKLKLEEAVIFKYIQEHTSSKVLSCFDFMINKIKEGAKIDNAAGYIWTLLEKGATEAQNSEKLKLSLLESEKEEQKLKAESEQQEVNQKISEENDVMRRKVLEVCADVLPFYTFLQMEKTMRVVNIKQYEGDELSIDIFIEHIYGLERELESALRRTFATEGGKVFIRLQNRLSC